MNALLKKELKDTAKLPIRLLYLYFIIEYVRIQDSFSFIGVIRPGLILALWLALSFFLNGDKKILKEPMIICVIAFIFLSILSFTFVVNHNSAFNIIMQLTIYLLAAMLPMISFINYREIYRKFIHFWLLMHLYIAIQSILFKGVGVGGFLRDENDMALAIGMVIPYAYFMAQSPLVSINLKRFYWSLFAIFTLATMYTMSRGGFIGLISVFAIVLYFSTDRIKKMLTITTVLIVLIPFIPSEYIDEVKTVTDTTESTANDRLFSWEMGWEMYLDHPVLGVGPMNYPWNVLKYEEAQEGYDPVLSRNHAGRVSHSLYFTLIPEYGTVGTLIFFYMIFLGYKRLMPIVNLNKTLSFENITPEQIECNLMAKALLGSAVCFFSAGTFITVLYYPHIWILIANVLVLERITKREFDKTLMPGTIK